jgi:ribosomal protein S18 acetylase RimI-like enzyme
MKLAKVTTENIEEIQQIARFSWENTYKEILAKEQLEYMLDMMYSKQEISKHINDNFNYHYYLIFDEELNNNVGFIGFENNYDGKTTKLHRIYLLPETKGKGFGKAALNYLKNQINEVGNNRIILAVNKQNEAKQFYESQGFSVYEEGVYDVGNGYVMDDYLMEWKK